MRRLQYSLGFVVTLSEQIKQMANLLICTTTQVYGSLWQARCLAEVLARGMLEPRIGMCDGLVTDCFILEIYFAHVHTHAYIYIYYRQYTSIH